MYSPALPTWRQGVSLREPRSGGGGRSRSKVNRFTGGIDLKNTPTDWLTQQFKAGMDVGQTTNQISPRPNAETAVFYGARSVGEKTLEHVTTTFNTLDYAATAKVKVFGTETATSVGAQYYRRRTNLASEFGRNFPTPDVTTIGGAATSTAGEDYVENKTLGFYVQEQLSWSDRRFLTLAMRGDANSAFGRDFNAAYYPKVSGAWVLNEEPFWKWPQVNTLRLRGAWGQAGQQPDVFDAVTLYTPTTGPGDVPILTPGSLGNTALKPERGEELELGFDAGFWQDRLTLAVTRFDRQTKDAIVRAPVRPSDGFPGVRVVNLGEMKSWGTEVGLNARARRAPTRGAGGQLRNRPQSGSSR
ncbi:MAG: TonB-dependent receptor [Gemmatimonadetes bacterium]|nr:TonB-dependent receptor [Gemmatimonadota bacterium]